ncbi:glycosyltransferase family 2 protein [Patescibacteria group bacterium]|nr:glycosyltransferase family 2 protein [Patescibacteria group bacterium]
MPWLRECFDSLKNQTRTDFDIYVVDNGSTDETVSVIEKEYDHVVLEKSKVNLGFGKGNNVSIKKALGNGAEIIILLNQDTVVQENFVEECVKAVMDPAVGLASPKILYKENNKIWWTGSKLFRGKDLLFRPQFQIATHIAKKEDDTGQFDTDTETDYIPGTALVTRKDVLEKIGLFDEDFFMYSEDVDLSLRAKEAGYTLKYFPSTTVYHDTPFTKKKEKFSFRRLWFKYSNYFRGVKRVVDKHFTTKEKIIWYAKLPFTLLLTLIYEVV